MTLRLTVPFFLLGFLFSLTSAKALVLEELRNQGKLEETLKDRKVGYYIGSFDPLHLGHEEVVKAVLKENLCDYILIYPAWGGDTYKTRAAVSDRLEMIFAVFKDYPKVIVTQLAPKKMQEVLTNPKLEGIKFIGIIGSDVALSHGIPSKNADEEAKRQKHLKVFMQGIKVPEKYAEHTIGGIMALFATSFIVAVREKDDLTPLKGKIAGRDIIATIKNTQYPHLSSTKVKKALKSRQSVEGMLDLPVLSIIKGKKLYVGW